MRKLVVGTFTTLGNVAEEIAKLKALGTGRCLFGEGTIPRSFRLVDTQLNTTKVPDYHATT